MSWLQKISIYEDTWEVRKDGRFLLRGTEFECMKYLHNNTSSSANHAMKYEGFTVTRSGTDWRDQYNFYVPEKSEQQLDPERSFKFFCKKCGTEQEVTPQEWTDNGHPRCPYCSQRMDVNL